MKKMIGLLKSMVKSLVFAFVGEIFEIFYSIVLLIFNGVYRILNAFMVDSFFRQKVTSKMLIHHKAMLADIILVSMVGMLRFVNTNISVLVNMLPTFPRRAITAAKVFTKEMVVSPLHLRSLFTFVPRNVAFFKRLWAANKRAVFSFFFYSVRPDFEIISTSFASKFNHLYLQIKKALFGVLAKIRCIFHLLRAFSLQKKIAPLLTIITLLLATGLSTNVYSANLWMAGSGEDTPLGSSNPSDIDTILFERINDPLDRVLSTYRMGAKIVYLTTSTLTVEAGSVVCTNAASTIRRMRTNTSSTTVTWSDIDTGAEAGSTTYYVWALADADATTFTINISLSSSEPDGATHFLKLGSFYNNSNSNITRIVNDSFYSGFGTWTSRSSGVIYQALTDGFVIAGAGSSAYDFFIDIGENSAPSTIALRENGGAGEYGAFCTPIKAGEYWKITGTVATLYWVSYE